MNILLKLAASAVLVCSPHFAYCEENIIQQCEPILNEIGSLVGDARPKCFFARCGTGEDPSMLRAHDEIVHVMGAMGIDIALDSRGDQGGLPYGEDIWRYMEEGIAQSPFVMLALTPAGLERCKESKSGYAFEITCILDRLDSSSEFFVPVLMAGTVKTSVPLRLRHTSVLTATHPDTQLFNMPIFMREMIPLLKDRFFKGQSRKDGIDFCLSRLLTVLCDGSQSLGSVREQHRPTVENVTGTPVAPVLVGHNYGQAAGVIAGQMRGSFSFTGPVASDTSTLEAPYPRVPGSVQIGNNYGQVAGYVAPGSSVEGTFVHRN